MTDKKPKFLGAYRRDKKAIITGACLLVFIILLILAGMPWGWGVVIAVGYLVLFYLMRNNP